MLDALLSDGIHNFNLLYGVMSVSRIQWIESHEDSMQIAGHNPVFERGRDECAYLRTRLKLLRNHAADLYLTTQDPDESYPGQIDAKRPTRRVFVGMVFEIP